MRCWLNYAPDHREDLAKSGLTFKVVDAHGIYSMRPCDISRIIKNKSANVRTGFHQGELSRFDRGDMSVNNVLVFPYLMEGSFCRYKLFWNSSYTGKQFRYWQPPDAGVRLYLTLPFIAATKNGNEDLYITEGEKKALKMSMEGYPACALGGVWNFGPKVFERLEALGVRRLNYIPDADVWGREDLKRSVVRFHDELKHIGCELIVKKHKGDQNGAGDR